MFGKNEITGRRFFNEQGGDALLVTSIFLTIQGEGPFAGRPAVFVRLAKCNLACVFCDTYFDAGDWMTISDIVSRVFDEINIKYEGRDMAHKIGVVITGGEPAIQPLMPALCRRLACAGMAFVQIETNGVMAIEDAGVRTTIVVSPKCAQDYDKKPLGYITPHPTILEKADAMKFVLTADDKSPYYTIPEWALEWHRDKNRPIYISPMNCYLREPAAARLLHADGDNPTPDLKQRIKNEVVSFWEPDLLNVGMNRLNHEYAAHYALEYGLFLSLQLHLYAGIA